MTPTEKTGPATLSAYDDETRTLYLYPGMDKNTGMDVAATLNHEFGHLYEHYLHDKEIGSFLSVCKERGNLFCGIVIPASGSLSADASKPPPTSSVRCFASSLMFLCPEAEWKFPFSKTGPFPLTRTNHRRLRRFGASLHR